MATPLKGPAALLGGATDQSDYDRLASTVQSFSGAEELALSVIAPVADAMSQLFWLYGAPLALTGIMFHMVRAVWVGEGASALRYLLWLLLPALLMAPVAYAPGVKLDTDSMKTSGSAAAARWKLGGCREAGMSNCYNMPGLIFVFNSLTSDGLNAALAIIDRAVGRASGKSFSAAFAGVEAVRRAENTDIRSSELHRTVNYFWDTCSDVVHHNEFLRAHKLTAAQLAAVGLPRGAIGVAKGATPADKAKALEALKKYKQNPGVFWIPYEQGGLAVESREYWKARLAGDKNQQASGLVPATRYPHLRPDAGEEQEFGPRKETRFVPENCGELYEVAEIGMRELFAATDGMTQSTLASMGGSAELQALAKSVAVGHAQLKAAYAAAGVTDDGEKSTWMASLGGTIIRGIESVIVTLGMRVVNFLAELFTKWFVFLLPALAALGVAVIIASSPLVALLTIVPGRERALPTVLYGLVWIKAVVLFAFLVIKVGGMITLAALTRFDQDGSMSAAGIALAGGLITCLATLLGSTKLASFIVFSDQHGLAAVGGASLGASHIAQAVGAFATKGASLAKQAAPGFASSAASGIGSKTGEGGGLVKTPPPPPRGRSGNGR